MASVCFLTALALAFAAFSSGVSSGFCCFIWKARPAPPRPYMRTLLLVDLLLDEMDVPDEVIDVRVTLEARLREPSEMERGGGGGIGGRGGGRRPRPPPSPIDVRDWLSEMDRGIGEMPEEPGV